MKLISILMLAGSLIGISAQESETAVVSFLVGICDTLGYQRCLVEKSFQLMQAFKRYCVKLCV